MAASVIEQAPLYAILPVGQEIIFTVSNISAVATEEQVKICVAVHLSNDTMPVTTAGTHLIGTFKATPNNAGVGIFDMKNIIESYTSADNRSATDLTGTGGPQYKGAYTKGNTYPIHLIDKFSMSTNSAAFMVLQFYVEYLGATNNGVSDPNVVVRADGTTVNSEEYIVFNGYIKYTDVIKEWTLSTPWGYGFDTNNFAPGNTYRRYLTNTPKYQGSFASPEYQVYANYNDYGTVALFQPNPQAANNVAEIIINYYGSDGVIIDSVTVTKAVVNGAYFQNQWTADTEKQILFLGVFPGNLQNWSATSNIPSAALLEGGSIAIFAIDGFGNSTLAPYRIYINCPEKKNYEPIRLAWLNQWGAWDYWTFTKQSTRSFKTKGTTYTQLQGSWNKSKYTIDSHKGGKKTFRVNSTEEIKINTDFVNEEYNVMFEELINSPEIYLLEGYQTDVGFSSLNNYVTPVTLKTSSFTKKTAVNDNLVQYTFTIEKTLTLRTQAI